MKKDIFDMLNDNNIDLNDYEKVELNDMEKMKMKKFARKNINKKPHRKFAKLAGFSAILGAAILITPFGQNVIATMNLPTYDIASLMGLDKNLDNYKTVIDQSISDNGVTVKLNEVILDGDILRVSTTTNIDNTNETYESISPSGLVYINGKKIHTGSSGTSEMIDKNTSASQIDFNLDISQLDLTKPLDIKIKYSDVTTSTVALAAKKSNQPKPINGNWTFNFNITPEELLANTKTIELNKKIIGPDNQILTIEKYTSNPLGQKLYIDYGENTLENSDMKFTGTDNLGNSIEFNMRYRNDTKAMFEIYRLEGGLSDKATEITLQAQYVNLPQGSGKIPNNYKNFGKPFVVNLK